uniref:ATP-dependent DNA helicase 2 subunit KU70 n=1 Tax=Tanacetum cinerariifolium TaxID=118510 RepID=A0A6L2JSK6_TANCI|nr:ATP-dependent DNA helicase 2 subunit KU70 [Tanacetum cinerariifolium]
MWCQVMGQTQDYIFREEGIRSLYRGVVSTQLVQNVEALYKDGPWDAQDIGISIELLSLSMPDEDFNVLLFYADLIGLEGDELAQFMPLAGERLLKMMKMMMTYTTDDVERV